MSRTGITYAEVSLAAEKFVQQGVLPTIERIRVLLGTGSYSTVSKYLNQWKAHQLKQRIDLGPSTTIPSDPINQAVAHVWKQLERDSAAKIGEIEAAAAEKIQLAQEEKAQVLEKLSQITKDNQDLRALLKETRAHNAALEKEHIALNQHLAVAQAQVQAAEEAKQTFTEYANKALVSLEEKYHQVLRHYEGQLGEVKQFYTQEISQQKEAAESWRHHHIVEIDQLKTTQQKLQGQLLEKEKALLEVIRHTGPLSTQLQQQQTHLEKIVASISAQEERAATLKEDLQQAISEVVKQAAAKEIQSLLIALQPFLNTKSLPEPKLGEAL